MIKTVKDACELQPNALEIRLSDQIEQLDELINLEGDGSAFFERTYITHVNGHQFLTHFSQIKLTHPLKWLKTARSAKYPPCAWPSAANSPL